jgi:pimeloyl-ACP methyl ester carboxylesterase
MTLAPPRPGRRRGFTERDESRYRQRMVRGAVYATSRQLHEDLAVVVQRFPVRHDPREDDPVFVLVHGIGVSSRYYRPLAAELAHLGAVYLVDLPGYGAAPDPRRDVTIADHAAVLASVMRRAGLTDAVLLGHSWGCQVVTALAEQQPAVTDRIVLMAPTVEPVSRTFWRSAFRLMRDGFREPPAVTVIAVTDYLVRCGLPYLIRQVPHMLRDAIERRLPGLRSRVLVVNGDRDPIVPSVWARTLSTLAPRGSFREVHGPHVIMHTDPVTIAEHIGAWLREEEPA